MKKWLILLALAALLGVFSPSLARATTVYVDQVGGNDGTGDGSYGNPYKTIGQADNGLSGGDEIRVALTPITALSGTLTFTEGSTSISTSADLTSELSAGDIISKYDGEDEAWWYVNAVTSDTITLEQIYYGSDQTTTGYVIEQPAAALSQALGSNGTSAASRLKCSGGWDLTTQTQTGLTLIWHNTSGNSAAFNVSGDYTEVSHFICLQTGYDYNDAFYSNAAPGSYFHDIHTVGDPLNGQFYLNSCDGCVVENITVGGTDDTACIQFYTSNQITATDLYAYGCSGIGITGQSRYSSITNLVARGTTSSCISDAGTGVVYSQPQCYSNSRGVYGATDETYITVIDPVFDTISGVAIDMALGDPHAFVYNPTCTSCTGGLIDVAVNSTPQDPVVLLIDSSGLHHSYYYSGVLSENTSQARSGSCMQYSPSYSATALINHAKIKLGVFKVTDGGTDVTLYAYMKDDASYNGTVYLYAESNFDRVVDLTEKTMTTSYVQQSITVPNASVSTGDWVTLYGLITGTAGSVYIDDFSASN